MAREREAAIMKIWPSAEVRIGEGARIDGDVILGYPSGRLSGKKYPVAIGGEAVIRSGSVVYQGTRVGHRFETGHHVVIREENTIGDRVQIWTNTVIDYGCKIGNNVKIHSNVYIAQ